MNMGEKSYNYKLQTNSALANLIQGHTQKVVFHFNNSEMYTFFHSLIFLKSEYVLTIYVISQHFLNGT